MTEHRHEKEESLSGGAPVLVEKETPVVEGAYSTALKRKSLSEKAAGTDVAQSKLKTTDKLREQEHKESSEDEEHKEQADDTASATGVAPDESDLATVVAAKRSAD